MIHTVRIGDVKETLLLAHCSNTRPRVHAEWDENSIAAQHAALMHDAPYLHEALEAKHYAAASDLIRLVALWWYGGCYVDLDVEIMEMEALFSLMLRAHFEGKVFIGKEDSHYVCGAVIVAPPKHPFIRRMLDVYAGLHFADTFDGKVTGTTLLTDEVYKRDDVVALEPSVFHPIHYTTIGQLSHDERRTVAKEFKSITLHHFAGSWIK